MTQEDLEIAKTSVPWIRFLIAFVLGLSILCLFICGLENSDDKDGDWGNGSGIT